MCVNDTFPKSILRHVYFLLKSLFFFSNIYIDTKYEYLYIFEYANSKRSNEKSNLHISIFFQVFFFMLTGRLVIDWQLRRKSELASTANVADEKTKKQD